MSSLPIPSPAPTYPALAEVAYPTVAEVIERYLLHVKTSGQHCQESIEQRVQVFGLFVEVYGNFAIADCKPFHLTDWIMAHKRWKSSSTKKAKANQINACFNWAVREGRIASNPFARITYQEAEPRPPMEDDAFESLVAHGNKRFERAVRYLRLTGCRLSEMTCVTWPMVDFEIGIVTLERHKTRKHTRKPRIIVLVQEAIDLLREIRSRQPDRYEGVVFLNNRNTPWNRRTLGQQLRRMKKLGQVKSDASLHGLRHAWCTAGIANGASLKLISEGAGHASSAITERNYVKLTAQHANAIRAAIQLALPKK
ncbi:MAG TPA: tyrosine-type recombinase/integrase [Gemmataceae bacterium]|nr:tyrosine-type recombinase/integrase [Gemmataceae bacterium]